MADARDRLADDWSALQAAAETAAGPFVVLPAGQVDVNRLIADLCREPSGWIMGDDGVPWSPMSGHRLAGGEHHVAHHYDGGCELCRLDQPAAMRILIERVLTLAAAQITGAPAGALSDG